MAKQIKAQTIEQEIKKICIQANIHLPCDVEDAIKQAQIQETSEQGKYILSILSQNIDIAKQENLPLCQDTGMVIVFLELGQDVSIVDGDLYTAINNAVKQAYDEAYFRKSIVSDPLLRENTGDNTPAIIYTDIVPGDQLKIQIMPKGFGSENMGTVHMLTPADGKQGIIDAVVQTVKDAGPNPCPPIILGIGIGGTMDKAAILSKKVLFRKIGSNNPLTHIKDLEQEILDKINATNIGPAGLGGQTTAFAVHIETYPTHIAGLPVAISFACNAARHAEVVL